MILIPLIEEKRKCYIAWQRGIQTRKLVEEEYKTMPEFFQWMASVQTVKEKCRYYHNLFYEEVAKDLQKLLDDTDVYGFYREIKARVSSGSSASRKNQSIVGARIRKIVEGVQDGDIVEGEEASVPIWREYLKCLLNQQTETQLDRAVFSESLREQGPVMNELDREYDIGELECAIKQGKNNKATGASGIPIEVMKAFDETNTQGLLEELKLILNTGEVPQTKRDSCISVLFKKGDILICANYRALCINEHLGKLMERLF